MDQHEQNHDSQTPQNQHDPKQHSTWTSCDSYREDISAWLDNELSPDEVNALKDHLDECEPCRLLECELRENWELVGSLSLPEGLKVPGDSNQFLESVENRIHLQKRRIVLRAFIGAATAAAFLLAVFSMFYGPGVTSDGEIIENLPVLVDLQQEAGDLGPDQLSILFEYEFTDINDGKEDGDSMDEFEFLLEEELEGTRL